MVTCVSVVLPTRAPPWYTQPLPRAPPTPIAPLPTVGKTAYPTASEKIFSMPGSFSLNLAMTGGTSSWARAALGARANKPASPIRARARKAKQPELATQHLVKRGVVAVTRIPLDGGQG